MLKINNLCFSYTGNQPYILNDINLTIDDGEYISIVGENGCGKTTLMRLILNFLQPTKGTIQIDTKRIGYVPQKNDFSNRDFPITVYESLNAYRHLLKIKDKNVIKDVLTKVSMTDFTHALVGTLSGGQFQRVSIARALMGEANLLILDEPSTGVDIPSQKEIYTLLKKLNRQNGVTIISVEHNLDAAIENSTVIFHLKNGKGHLCTPEHYSQEVLQNNLN